MTPFRPQDEGSACRGAGRRCPAVPPGGISRRLVGFADVLVRRRTGGLGMVTVLAAAFFAALSGSAPATTAAIRVYHLCRGRGRGGAVALGGQACLGALADHVERSVVSPHRQRGRTDLIAIAPSRLLHLDPRLKGLQSALLPLEEVIFSVDLCWDLRTEREPGQRWLRKMMSEIFQNIDTYDRPPHKVKQARNPG